MKPKRDPLEPLSFAVLTLGGLVIGIVVVGALLAVFVRGSGASVFGFGDPDVCLDVPQSAFAISDEGSGGTRVAGLRQGVSQIPDEYLLCKQHASTAEHLLGGGGQIVEFVFFVGFILLCVLLIRTARRRGLFTRDVARILSRLGGYLLVGEVVVGFVVAGLDHALLAGMARPGHGPRFTSLLSWSWPVVVAGFGVLTAGRVLAGSAQLQQEIDTLV